MLSEPMYRAVYIRLCNRRNCRCSTIRKTVARMVGLVDRTLMPAGITGLCRRVSLTTKRSATAVSEDRRDSYCVAHIRSSMSLHTMQCGMAAWIHTIAVCHAYPYTCIYNAVAPGLGVPVVSSSFTDKLHPTPCIEWMQGKRGDPGCMAKAFTHPLPHVIAVCACHRIHMHSDPLPLTSAVCALHTQSVLPVH